MAVAATVAAVTTAVGTIEGIRTVKQGMPNDNKSLGGYDETMYPLANVTGPHNFKYTRAGMGITGVGFVEYDVRITIAMGSLNAAQDAAIARALPIVDRIRAEFTPDWTLSGLVFNTDLTATPADNLDIFKDLQQPPVAQFTLHVIEERVVNEAAA